MPFRRVESDDGNYRNVPVRGLFELRRLMDALENRLSEVTCPIEILQNTGDPVIDPESATLIHDRIGSTDKIMHVIDCDRHGILHDDIGNGQGMINFAYRRTVFLARTSIAPRRASTARRQQWCGQAQVSLQEDVSSG